MALVLAAYYNLGRVGFATQTGSVITVTCISWFILLAPDFTLRFHKIKKSPFADSALLSVCIVLLMVISGMLVTGTNYLSGALVLLGILLLLIQLYGFLVRREKKSAIGMAAVLVLGSGIAVTCWNGRHLSPVFFEMLSAGEFSGTEDFGRGIDTLFHTSLAQMIRTYGVPSIGIDGLVPIHYHYGSHFVLAQLGKLFNMHTLHIYQLAYPIIFFPLFIKVFIVATLRLRHYFKIDRIALTPGYWLILLIIFFGAVPYVALNKIGLNLETIWVSESYLISMILFFCVIILGVSVKECGGSLQVHRMSGYNIAAAVIFLAIFGAMGFAKASTMAIVLVIFLYVAFRRRLYRDASGIIYISLVLATFFIVISNVTEFNRSQGQDIFYSIKQFVAAPWLFVGYFSLTALAFVLYVLQRQSNSGSFFKLLFHTDDLMPAEIIAVCATTGLACLVLLGVEGGSAFYFSEIQYWLAAAVLLALSPELWNLTRSVLNRMSFNISGFWIKGMACVYMLAMIFLNIAIRGATTLYANYHLRHQIVSGDATVPLYDNYTMAKKIASLSVVHAKEIAAIFDEPMEPYLIRRPMYNLLLGIRNLDQLDHKRETIVFIRDYIKFIDGFPCYKYPFIVPALAGLTTWQGWDKEACYWIRNYGFDDYPKRDRSFYNASTENLCKEIDVNQFSQIVVYDLAKNSFSTIDCRQ